MNAPVPPYVTHEEVETDGAAPPPGASRRLLFIIGGVILAVAVVIYVLTHIGGVEGEDTEVDPRQAVTVIRVQQAAFSPRISLSGEARPVRDIQVYAPASGVRILELLADEGDTVRAGQPLARLDTALSNAQTRAAQASVAEADSAAIRARGEYERAEAIRESGALSAEAIEQRRAAAAAADARLAAARAQLAEVNARLQGGYVRAPIAGLVISRTAELGRPVDGQLLFRIAGGNDLEVAAQVAEADILALREGQTATFRLVDNSEVVARLRRTAASIDSRTRTGEALFQLPRNSRVRAGMYLRGEAALGERQALAVPQAAVLYDNGQPYVFVIDGRNTARRTPVQLGYRQNDRVEVLGGLAQGARIAGAGAAFLQNGDGVRPIEPQTQRAPAQPQTQSQGESLRGRGE
ncbi:MAG: efflux RND transporter periplasmic adaptor subunit [Hyphomonadaceae bacterium]